MILQCSYKERSCKDFLGKEAYHSQQTVSSLFLTQTKYTHPLPKLNVSPGEGNLPWTHKPINEMGKLLSPNTITRIGGTETIK